MVYVSLQLYFSKLYMTMEIKHLYWKHGKIYLKNITQERAHGFWNYLKKEKSGRWYIVGILFCGNMMSSQWSESFNGMLTNYLTSKLRVVRLFEQFERVLEDRRHVELQEDYKMMDQSVLSKVLCLISRQMVQLYTPSIFQK